LIGLFGAIAIAANLNLRGAFASSLIMGQGPGGVVAENKTADKIKCLPFGSDERLDLKAIWDPPGGLGFRS
jgi:hypothetical protein